MAAMEECQRCGEVAKLRQRDFSPTALATLFEAGELEEELIDEALCDTCYGELREFLIDAANQAAAKEVATALKRAS